MQAMRKLPIFSLGGRETRVVQVGSEYAAIYIDTGAVIEHRTCGRGEAIELALKAAKVRAA